MKKTPLLLIVFLFLSACSLFRAKVLPYPEGIIFPLRLAHEVAFEGEITDYLVRKDNRLYFSTRNGSVHCIDAESREVVWRFQADNGVEMHPSIGKESLYVFDHGNTVYCLDMAGQLLWKRNVTEAMTSGICEGQEQIFFGTEKGQVFSLSQTDGHELWNFKTGEALRTDPVFYQGNVVLGSDDHCLYVINQKGKLISKFEADDKIQGGLLLDQGKLYFGSDGHQFYCFDLVKHKMKWKVKTGGKVRAYPISDKKRVFFLCMNNVLYCLNKKNGTLLWWMNIPARSYYRPEIIGDKITVSALSPKLVCFEVETGKIVGEHEAPKEVRSNPLWIDPFLMFAQHDYGSNQGKLLFMDKSVYVTLTPSQGSPQPPNEEIIFTASPTGFHLPKYEFYFKRYVEVRFGLMSYILLQVDENMEASGEKSEEDIWSWFPEKPGVYVIGVRATDEREKAVAEFPFLIEGSEEI
jgi:outer membrane protein assembly factor BamB